MFKKMVFLLIILATTRTFCMETKQPNQYKYNILMGATFSGSDRDKQTSEINRYLSSLPEKKLNSEMGKYTFQMTAIPVIVAFGIYMSK